MKTSVFLAVAFLFAVLFYVLGTTPWFTPDVFMSLLFGVVVVGGLVYFSFRNNESNKNLAIALMFVVWLLAILAPAAGFYYAWRWILGYLG